MTATDGVATSGSRPELISATYRRLQGMGFEDPEAANLTALKNGVAICTEPWTFRELTHLLFLRALRRAGRRWSGSDDRVDSALPVRDGASIPAGQSKPRADADQADGAVNLLTLFRAMADPNATHDLLRRSASRRLDAAGDSS